MNKKITCIIGVILVLVVIFIIVFLLNKDEGDNKKMDNIKENVSNDITFDFDTHTVLLNSGYKMPLNGIGTYSLTGDVCYNSIRSALDSGVRLIDTAYM